jgi:exonuclease III
MDAAAPVTIKNNFQLVHQLPCKRHTGGVAVYKRNDFAYATMPVHTELTASYQTKLRAMSHVGDIIVTQVSLPDESKFILATVYVHQRVTYNDLAVFLTSWLLQYRDLINYLGLEGEVSVPMVLVGDFNISEDDQAKLKEYLHKHFHLELKNDPGKQTMLSGSCINLTFSRYMHLICKPYVSYFSYHCPVFNKITL